jgi:hypothetical protein
VGSETECLAGVVSVRVEVDMLMIGRPDFTCIEVRNVPCDMESRSLASTSSPVIPLVTSRVYVVLTEDNKALLLPLTMVILTALGGTSSASDTLPTMACKNNSLLTSVELIPSNTWQGLVRITY